MKVLKFVLLFIILFTVISCENAGDKKNDSDQPQKQSENNLEEKILFFEQRFGTFENQKADYKFTFRGNSIEISYQYSDNPPTIEKAELKDGKIVVDGCSDCYIINHGNLCVPNSETDESDCYTYIESKSTHSIEEIINPVLGNQNQNINDSPSNDKIRNIVNNKISNKYFYNDENGLYTVIHFEPVNDGAPLGAMILSQLKCNFSFTYEIDGNKIDTKFLESGCGRTSTDRTFFYDETEDYIYMNIEGQKFIFTENP